MIARQTIFAFLSLSLLSPAAAGVKEASAPGLRTAYYAEGAVLPTAAGPAASYLESRPAQDSPPPEQPLVSEPPVSKGLGAFRPRDPAWRRYKEERTKQSAQPGASRQARSRYRLWPTSGADDQASDAARGDYERRMLGADKGVPAAPLDYPAQEGVYGRQNAGRPMPSGEVFVAVDLGALDRAEDLRDAVAGLSAAAGFRPDMRFPPERFAAGGADRVSLRGWIPTGMIAQAARAPGVLRLELQRPTLPARTDEAATAAMLVGIRIPVRAKAAETFQRVISELRDSAQFRWTHTVGFQAVPGGADVALLVIGEVPIARLSRLMGHPDVLKIASAPPEIAHAAKEVEQARPGILARFGRFIVDRAPYLLVITFLLLIPAMGAPLTRALKTFIPYH